MKRLGYILFGLLILYFIFLIRQDIINNLGLKREEKRIIKGLQQEERLATRLQNRLKSLKQDIFIEELANEFADRGMVFYQQDNL